MTTFGKIIEAIKVFGYPYEPDIYRGPEKKYFTYNYADDRGGMYADDEPQSTIVSIQLHLFLPVRENFLSIRNKVRRELFKQGFTYPEVEILLEKDIRHIIFECDIEEEMED